MQPHDTLPYVIAAYGAAWTMLAGYFVYLRRLGKRLAAEAEADTWE